MLYYIVVAEMANNKGEYNMNFSNYESVFNELTRDLTKVKFKQPNCEYTQHKLENGYRVEIPAIGATKNDISVNVENSTLKVTVNPTVNSSYSRKFENSWFLMENVDVDSINAKLDNGLLTVTILDKQPVVKRVNVAIN